MVGDISAAVVFVSLAGDWLWGEVPVEEGWEQIFEEFGGGLHAGGDELHGSGVWVDGDVFLSEEWAGIDTLIDEVPGGSGICIAGIDGPGGCIASAVFGQQ